MTTNYASDPPGPYEVHFSKRRFTALVARDTVAGSQRSREQACRRPGATQFDAGLCPPAERRALGNAS
jgi:hypothetical protein